jgi:transcriptional regulator with XRE-family HTH domain
VGGSFLLLVVIVGKGRGGGKTPDRVVELIRNAVAEKSQSAVARESGLTLLTVQRYLKGVGEPTHETLRKLSVYFDTPVWELRGDILTPEVKEARDKFWQVMKARRAGDDPERKEQVAEVQKIAEEWKAKGDDVKVENIEKYLFLISSFRMLPVEEMDEAINLLRIFQRYAAHLDKDNAPE